MIDKKTIKGVAHSIKGICVPVHHEGTFFIGAFAIVSAVLMALYAPLGWIGLVCTAWCVYFFRNPDRHTPDRKGLIFATGDGIIQKIEKVAPPAELELGDEKLTCISIFLNVFNVHVQRTPMEGKITDLHYRPGKFLSADLDKASEENERQSAVVENEDGQQVIFVQIAGLVARRILCDLAKGQEVSAGERYGIIRFGSRCDIYLPKGANTQVCVGQMTIGGETVIADLKSREKTRTAITH
jgi:phosphatidylserine decarboxylase